MRGLKTWYSDVNGIRNTVSHSQPNPSSLPLPLEEMWLITTFLMLHLFWLSSWKRLKKQDSRRIPWQTGKGVDFPERFVWLKAWCLVKGRSHGESPQAAKGQCPWETAVLSSGCKVWGRSEKEEGFQLHYVSLLVICTPCSHTSTPG